MKVSVYTITKNEENNCEGFMSSVKDADEVCILDTGSTDKTVEILRDLGARVEISDGSNFRFDRYRNQNLNMVSKDSDICFCIDLDERIEQEDWRTTLENFWRASDINQLVYPYVWNHREDGSNGTTFWYEKIHSRHEFRWIYPVHEILDCLTEEKKESTEDIVVHHYPDLDKKRDYINLLKLSIIEDPDNERHIHYLGRELMFNKEWKEAIKYFTQHVSIKNAWAPEKAASYRYMATCYAALGDFAREELCLLQACSEASGEREPWIDLGKFCLRTHQWAGGVWAAQRALALENKPKHYICDAYSWNEGPFDIMAVCYFYMGLRTKAVANVVEAYKRAPYDSRIQYNYNYIKNSLEPDET